jgi:adenylate kinase
MVVTRSVVWAWAVEANVAAKANKAEQAADWKGVKKEEYMRALLKNKQPRLQPESVRAAPKRLKEP